MSRYRLHYAPDNASLIIRLALEELRQPFDTVLVDRMQQAQQTTGYRSLNPAGRIPTLETPQGPISETAAILLWLADRHGGLAPPTTDPARGTFLNWLFYLSNTLHPDLLILFYTDRYGPVSAKNDLRASAAQRVLNAYRILHDEARLRLPEWFCASEPSVLDLYVAATLRWARLYPTDHQPWLDMSDFPEFRDMCARLDKRPSVASLCAAEGMTPNPFTAPQAPNPPEGAVL